ncbi:MAG: septation protein SpoVG family protein [Nitrospinales bacterium]
MIQVTEVKIYPFETGEPSSHIKAYADVTLADSIVLKGFRIIASKSGGLFIGFPSRKGKDNAFHDMIIPKTAEMKNHLRDQILEEFKNYTLP